LEESRKNEETRKLIEERNEEKRITTMYKKHLAEQIKKEKMLD